MNTFNEFELNRIKRLYADELASRRQTLQRSRSTKVNGGSGGGGGGPTCWPYRSHRHRNDQNLIGVHTRSYLLRDQDEDEHLEGHLRAEDLQAADVVNLKRYQHALATKKRPKARARTQSSSKFGRALYDFQAQSGQELSLRRGDLVELLEVLEGNKWARVEDCQSGLQGLVPLNYLDPSIGCAVAKRDVNTSSSSSSNSRPNSRMSTSGQKEPPSSLLAMSKGEPIALIRRLSGHLYEASNTRQATGLVWSNDLDIIKQPSGATDDRRRQQRSHSSSGQVFSDEFTEDDDDDVEDQEGEEEEQDSRVPTAANRYQYRGQDDDDDQEEEEMIILDSGERVLARRPHQRRRAKSASGAYTERGPPAGQVQRQVLRQTTYLAERKEQQLQTCSCCCNQTAGHLCFNEPRRSSSSPMISTAGPKQSLATDLPGQQAQQQADLPRLCRARYAYKPRQKDELELVPDDILVVVHECDDGWFIGSSYATNKMGTFPGNFVEPIN